ncbi:MAG TPA: hypothetical protein VHY19_06220 [Steroidobacteraceae bacterium]|nr:hypothetical protein [Steroidobacteraceae bacterium]
MGNSVQLFNPKLLISLTGALVGAVLSLAPVSSASASETKSFVVSAFTNAAYSTKEDCQGGIDPDQTDQYALDMAALGMPSAQIKKLMAGYPSFETMAVLVNRGRVDGKPVNGYTNPASVIDPKLHLVDAPYAYGFNLDGKGADSPHSFQDPVTHEKGIDNQLFRVFGCNKNFRGPPANATPPMFYGIEWSTLRASFPAWLISISGDDLSKDGSVTVTIDRSIDHVLLDANGNTEAYTTFRVDPDPRSHNVFQARLEHGVVTLTDHHDLHLVGDPVLISYLDLTHTHLRMTLESSGEVEGLVGGYQPWQEIFLPIGHGAENFEENQGIDTPGLYYALRHLADADPDPQTGQNRSISVAWQFEAVPAFVVPAPGAAAAAVLSADSGK